MKFLPLALDDQHTHIHAVAYPPSKVEHEARRPRRREELLSWPQQLEPARFILSETVSGLEQLHTVLPLSRILSSTMYPHPVGA